MNKINYSFLFCTLILGCTIKKTESLRDNNFLQRDKTFADFFRTFSIDSTFQAERIRYPLPYFYYEDYSSDTLSVSEIQIGKWRYVNFAEDSLAETYKENAFKIEINEIDSNSVDYLQKGIDNGIYLIYSFSKDKSRWYLTKVTNESN